MIRRLLAAAAIVIAACNGSGEPDAGPASDAGRPDGTADSDTGSRDVSLPLFDGGLLVVRDVGPPQSCSETCECPQGEGCIEGTCRTAGVGSVYCCTKPGCPSQEVCLGPNDQPGRCPAAPDAGPDAGSIDSGQGFIGSECEFDSECDRALGFTCWSQDEPPFLWGGYCTLEDCFPSCPMGSECIQFTGSGVTGCMQSCTRDSECRPDAYCLMIPSSTIQICFPDCRDDVFDCAPRDGTVYCSRATGQCEMTPMQNPNGMVGDLCADNRDCGLGQVCLGEFAWRLTGGLCSQVCSGLPEASACGVGETCQDYLGVGFCFKDCVNGGCPNRVDAICDSLDPTWPTDSCVPM
jgi:hypothetical protein